MPQNNLPHADMISKSAAVLDALTPQLYAYLLSLLPTPESYGALHHGYRSSFAAFLDGDPQKAQECEAARNAINVDLAILLGLAKAVAPKDPTVQEKLRLIQTHQKSAVTAAGILGDPRNFRVTFDKKGHPFASVTSLPRAKGYEIWGCSGDPSIESNWSLMEWSTKCKHIPLPGLNRTRTNFLRIRGMGANKTPGPWSSFIPVESA